jgi:hypothetical protein
MGMRASLLLCVIVGCSSALPTAERSTIRCGPCQGRADGFERVRVIIELRDALGAPVRGARVIAGDKIVSSGDDGTARALFVSRAAGPRKIAVRLADPPGTELGSVAVEFVAGSFPRVDFLAPR